MSDEKKEIIPTEKLHNAKYGDVPTQADYETTRNEFTETVEGLKATNSFATSETVTPEIAKKQGEAWLDYLNKKAEKPEGQER